MIPNNPLLRPALAVFTLKLVGEIAGFLTLAILAARGDLADLGEYTLTLTWGVLLGSLSVRGDGATLACLVPVRLKRENPSAARAILRWALFRSLLHALGLSFLTLVLSALTIVPVASPVFLSVSIPFWAFLILGRDIFRSLGIGWRGDLALFAIVPAGCVAMSAHTLHTPLLIGLPVLAAVLFSGLVLLIEFQKISGTAKQDSGEHRHEWRDLARAMALNVVSRQVLQRLDILAVGWILGVEAAAIYSVLARLAAIPLAFVDPLQADLRRNLRLAMEIGQDAAARATRAAAGVHFPTLGLGAALLVVLADPLLLRLGIEGAGAKPVLLILVLARTVGGYGVLARTVLAVGGEHKRLARANVLIAIGVLPLSLGILTSWMDLVGAAVSVFLAWSGLTVSTIALARARFGSFARTNWRQAPGNR